MLMRFFLSSALDATVIFTKEIQQDFCTLILSVEILLHRGPMCLKSAVIYIYTLLIYFKVNLHVCVRACVSARAGVRACVCVHACMCACGNI